MDSYKTVGEKSEEWGISQRHVQYLCRTGKIDGVIKRAGSWFISANTPSPAKNSKSNAANFNFVGTRKRILDKAIELFMRHGFDSVSLRDIGEAVGIRQSTIYNHFRSKQEILDTIYSFYKHHHLENRPSLDEMSENLNNKSLFDIFAAISYDFSGSIIQQMLDITKILLQRIGIDDKAREICKSLMLSEGITYVDEVFKMGIESGRFSQFDTHTLSIFINSVRLYTLFSWIADPSAENMSQIGADESALYRYCAEFLGKHDSLTAK